MALASRLRGRLGSRFAPGRGRIVSSKLGRAVGSRIPSRLVAPARQRTLTGSAGRFVVQLRRGRPVRGGFFKSLVKGVGKVVGTVTKLPVVGTVAKAALSSLPVVGQVMTVAKAVKGLTAASASAGIAGGVSSLPAAGLGGLGLTSTALPRGMRRKKRTKAKAKRRAKRRTKRAAKRRSKGGTAKQRAARARFARAAKRGRIKKGTRLR